MLTSAPSGPSSSSAATAHAQATSTSTYLATQAAARGWGPSTSTSLVAGDRRKIHTSFTAPGKEREVVEEYAVADDALLVRKLRAKTPMGQWSDWTFEVGEPVDKFTPGKTVLMESASNPLFVRQDSATHFVFRIRNLPWPRDNYDVTIEDATQEIVLRTKNKKYYKRMSIPDLVAGGADGQLSDKFLSVSHANNTLLIQYVKPPFILKLDKQNRTEIKKFGNGTTASSAASSSSSSGAVGKPQTAAQALLANAHPETAGAQRGGADEFAGLNGLKGLGNKDADCKQQ